MLLCLLVQVETGRGRDVVVFVGAGGSSTRP